MLASILIYLRFHIFQYFLLSFNKCVFGLKVNRNGFNGGNDFLNISYN